MRAIHIHVWGVNFHSVFAPGEMLHDEHVGAAVPVSTAASPVAPDAGRCAVSSAPPWPIVLLWSRQHRSPPTRRGGRPNRTLRGNSGLIRSVKVFAQTKGCDVDEHEAAQLPQRLLLLRPHLRSAHVLCGDAVKCWTETVYVSDGVPREVVEGKHTLQKLSVPQLQHLQPNLEKLLCALLALLLRLQPLRVVKPKLQIMCARLQRKLAHLHTTLLQRLQLVVEKTPLRLLTRRAHLRQLLHSHCVTEGATRRPARNPACRPARCRAWGLTRRPAWGPAWGPAWNTGRRLAQRRAVRTACGFAPVSLSFHPRARCMGRPLHVIERRGEVRECSAHRLFEAVATTTHCLGAFFHKAPERLFV
jgi:hypothetical protein